MLLSWLPSQLLRLRSWKRRQELSRGGCGGTGVPGDGSSLQGPRRGIRAGGNVEVQQRQRGRSWGTRWGADCASTPAGSCSRDRGIGAHGALRKIPPQGSKEKSLQEGTV